MKKNILTLLLGSFLLFHLGHLIAAEAVVYQWVDKNNVTHFSELQPENIDYKTIEVLGNKAKKTRKNTEKNNTNAEPSPNTPLTTEIAERCEEAKNNIEVLESHQQVKAQNAKGEFKVLTEEEKQEQLRLSQKQVAVYCAES